jgi:hypothetical protein
MIGVAHSLRTAALLGLTVLPLGLAHADADDSKARCTVRIIHAVDPDPKAPAPKPGETKIDPKIDRLRPYLTRPPFTAWHEFVLLEKKYVHMVHNKPEPFLLPNGKPATLTFVEHLPDQPGRPHRVRLQLQVGDTQHPTLSTVFVVDEGGIVLQAGQKHDHGMLILGTSCELLH